MTSEDATILKLNQYYKFNKATFIIYADLESLTEEMDRCEKKSEKSFTTKVGEHVPLGFSMSTISSFKYIENKYSVFRGKDCIKKIFKCLKNHGRRIIDFKKKKMKLLTNKQQEWYENRKNP